MEVILEEVTRFQNFATVDLRDLVAILEKVPATVLPPSLLQHAACPDMLCRVLPPNAQQDSY